MVEKSTSGDMELGDFLEAAGRSLAEAQVSLVPDLNVPVNMMLSNADLEVKVAVSKNAVGRLTVRTIPIEDILRGDIDAGTLSTIRVTYVATLGESMVVAAQTAAPSAEPTKAPEKTPVQVIEEIRRRPAITKLEQRSGTLDIKPSFVPEQNRWLVTLRSKDGKVVREMIVPDEPEGKDVAR
ncbi:MAG: hypothetical protein Q8Q07_03550 [Dehalococcoidales bacterium]|nr:hypothetical protein [Dehalococcoidales bacterium]